ncbi:MAG: hypothetical protein WC954_04900 [Sphaerochaeta sp.]
MEDDKTTTLIASQLKGIKTTLVILLILFGIFLVIQIQPLIPSSPSAEKEIAAAKNTTEDDALIAVMIGNIDPSAKWTHFMATNGREVVQVTGSFQPRHTEKMMEVLTSPEMTGNRYSGVQLDIDEQGGLVVNYFGVEKQRVSSIDFRLQFIKIKDYQLIQNTSPYNSYRLGYSEIIVTGEDGEIDSHVGPERVLQAINLFIQEL